MAYARFGNDSDVYVYDLEGGGYQCERCPSIGHEFRCAAASEIIAHLLAHRARGDKVPDDAIVEIVVDLELAQQREV